MKKLVVIIGLLMMQPIRSRDLESTEQSKQQLIDQYVELRIQLLQKTRGLVAQDRDITLWRKEADALSIDRLRVKIRVTERAINATTPSLPSPEPVYSAPIIPQQPMETETSERERLVNQYVGLRADLFEETRRGQVIEEHHMRQWRDEANAFSIQELKQRIQRIQRVLEASSQTMPANTPYRQ